ncbi:hypothetical protein [uncultured Eubacterium sp.]|uniref:hypothetical protein n=1 Tax=uncultured Eubacterium sp. TaxID=165185 RepID=UPI002597D035|nr:hypothetical protein [uncultured Eubacterium sp.]
MKIDLVKLNFDDTHSYKYKPFKYCCKAIQDNKTIEFTNEDLENFEEEHIYEDDYIPRFCTSYAETIKDWGDEWELTTNYPIKFCPHCGEKIEINIVEKIDVSEKYNELVRRQEELRKQCQETDSKREESELREKLRKLNNQIDDFYKLNEWNENNGLSEDAYEEE